MFKKRVISALCIFLLLFFAVWFDKPLPWFLILVAVWGAFAVLEFYRIAADGKVQPLRLFGLLWTLLFILSPYLNNEILTPPLLLTSALMLSLICLIPRRNKEGIFLGWAWTIAGVLYTGWLLSYFVTLRELDHGRNWVYFALFITFASDIAAFFVGRALGKHKLAPSISPHKTWEGAIAGLIGALIISLLFTLPTPLSLPLGYGQAILLGLLVSIFGQLGDLAESLLKRSIGIKDSGNSIPGHGGFLDRMDSIVFAGVVVYYYVIWAVQ